MDSSASSMGRAEPSCVGPILGAQAMEARWRLFQMLAVRGEEMLGSGIFPGADLARLAMGVPSCNIPTMPNVYLIPTYFAKGLSWNAGKRQTAIAWLPGCVRP